MAKKKPKNKKEKLKVLHSVSFPSPHSTTFDTLLLWGFGGILMASEARTTFCNLECKETALRDNIYEFIKKVTELAGKYGCEVSAKEAGQSVGAFYVVTIKDVGVEVRIKAGRCIIRDANGNSTQFEELYSDEWEQESLDYIHAILK